MTKQCRNKIITLLLVIFMASVALFSLTLATNKASANSLAVGGEVWKNIKEETLGTGEFKLNSAYISAHAKKTAQGTIEGSATYRLQISLSAEMKETLKNDNNKKPYYIYLIQTMDESLYSDIPNERKLIDRTGDRTDDENIKLLLKKDYVGVDLEKDTSNQINYAFKNILITREWTMKGVIKCFAVYVHWEPYQSGQLEYGTKYSILAKTPLYSINYKEELENYIENENVDISNENEKRVYEGTSAIFRQLVGRKTLADQKATVTVNYKKMNTFYSWQDASESFAVDAEYMANKEAVTALVLNGKNIAKYNASYLTYKRNTEGAYKLKEEIVRQAKGFEYTYDEKAKTATLTVIYTDFNYKDFSIKVENNDAESNLFFNIKTIDAKVGDSETTLTFDFGKIEEQTQNMGGWLPGRTVTKTNPATGEEEEIFVPGLLAEDFQVNGESENVSINVDGENRQIVVTFSNEHEADLFGIGIIAVAQLVEDVPMTMCYEYTVLDENLNETTETSEGVAKMYSEVLKMSDETFIETYGDVIKKAVSPAILNGAEFFKLKGFKRVYSRGESGNYDKVTFKAIYDYTPLVKTNNSEDSSPSYKALNLNTLSYKASDFSFNVPAGFRICGFRADNADAVKIAHNIDYPLESSINFLLDNDNKKMIYTVTAEVTDLWKIEIEYLEQFKSQVTGKGSCFAEKKKYVGKIKVAKYDDIFALTVDDVSEILQDGLGKELKFIDFIKIPIKMESATVTRVGDTYHVATEYTKTAIKAINSDGSYDYFSVKLTNFKTWLDYFGGKEWNIVSLAPDVFKYSDAVKPENLYGFFTVMTFKEQVRDFNSWFREYTENGCVTFFNQTQVKGSDFYKFLHDNPAFGAVAGGVIGFFFGHPVAGAVTGEALQLGVMSIAEYANDENGTYYSYFLYLDGTSDKVYSASNGADDYDDTDSASKNWVENVGQAIGDFFAKIWQAISDWWNSPQARVVKIILIVFISVLAGAVLIKTCIKIFKK